MRLQRRQIRRLTCTVGHLEAAARCAVIYGTDGASAGQGRAVVNREDSEMIVRQLGRADYEPTFAAMKEFTCRAHGGNARTNCGSSSIRRYSTLGQAGKPEHLLRDTGIPLVKIDRGGPDHLPRPRPGGGRPADRPAAPQADGARAGQPRIEQAVIDCLGEQGVTAERRDGAPGASMSARPRSLRSGCGCGTAAATMASASTWIWTCRRSRRSTPVALPAWRSRRRRISASR